MNVPFSRVRTLEDRMIAQGWVRVSLKAARDDHNDAIEEHASEGSVAAAEIQHGSLEGKMGQMSTLHRAHQGDRVAPLHHTGSQAVVEDDAFPVQLILEVDVGRMRLELLGDPRERQVVCRHQPHAPLLDQAADQRLGTDPPVVRVRTVEDLVEQKKESRFLLA